MRVFNRRTARTDADKAFRNSAAARAVLHFFSYSFLFIFILSAANNSFGQDAPEILTEKINRGSIEQKRDALHQIRNLKTVEASTIAVPALRDAAEIVRATAAFSVIYLPPDQAVQRLLPNLWDKSELVRRETAYALGEVGSANATVELLRIVQTDKQMQVREASAVALGKIGDVSAVDALIKVLQSNSKTNDEFLRRASARSLGQIAQIIQTNDSKVRTPENFSPDKSLEIEKPTNLHLTTKFPVFSSAAEVLIRTLQSPREAADVKREAAFALGEIGDERAIPILQANLNGDDYYLAQICRESLRKILYVKKLREAVK